jgi:hypothetical protein
VAAPSPSHPLENPVDFSPGERVKDKHRRYCTCSILTSNRWTAFLPDLEANAQNGTLVF